jgi:2-oxoglutarate dehydrogenase E2 component (dihydrolipoamide succinyltransferase)
MPTPVVMPQMGESIAEGTIVRWIKKVGDPVDRDEPLFEISTDKVDAEIPSPAAGILTEISVKEGETVAVNSVVATIRHEGEEEAAAPAKPATGQSRKAADRAAAAAQPQPDGSPTASAAAPSGPAPVGPDDRKTERSASAAGAAARANGAERDAPPSPDDLRRQKSSPLVRRIAKEHNVDISRIPGSGIGGRVTKHDILEYLDAGDSGPEARDSGPWTPDSGLGTISSPG